MGRKEYVYFIQDGDRVKIGRSYYPEKRLFQLRMEKTKEMRILSTRQAQSFEDACMMETYLHRLFSDQRVSGEWFKLDKPIMDWINNLESDGGSNEVF